MAQTRCGTVEYSIEGDGLPVLMAHGAGGGYDQVLDLASPLLKKGFRTIAVSRFGYLRFVLLSLLFGVAPFRDWFRFYTLAIIVVLLVPAIFAFWYAPQIDTGQAMPGLGLGERNGQYELWQVTLAAILTQIRK